MKEEFIVAKEYIHKKSIGNGEEIRANAKPITDFLKDNFKEESIEGYRVLFINREETLRKKLIFSNYKKETNDVYPFLYITIQFFDSSGNEEIEAFVKENGFCAYLSRIIPYFPYPPHTLANNAAIPISSLQ